MEKNKIYIYTKTSQEQRYKVVIWVTGQYSYCYHQASFYTIEQFENYMKMFGISYKYLETRFEEDKEREFKIYETDYEIKDYGGFRNLNEIPQNAVKYKGLSNGRIVDCYFYKNENEKTIYIYRPNPNDKEIYKPLETSEHIAYQKLYGIF